MNDLKYHKDIPSSLSNSISINILELCNEYRTISPSEEKVKLYRKIVNSDFLQDKYLDSRYGSTLIKPIDHTSFVAHDGRSFEFKYSTVSIEALMRKVLANQSVVKKIIEEKAQERGQNNLKINSLKGSEIWPRLKGRMKLELYIDEANLSPSNLNGYQKTTFVYATFADLPFQYRCHKEDIDVVMVANHKKLSILAKANGITDPMGALLRPLRDELSRLIQDGISIEFEGQSTTVYLGLSCICGDNSGIYQLLGKYSNFIL